MADIETFISKWKASGGAERANYAGFLYELCDLIGVERPDVSVGGRAGDYTFERPVHPRDSAEITNPKRIDLYKRNCFILEAKQSRLPDQKNALPGQLSLAIEETPRGERTSTRAWDVMMRNARKQAEGYVFLLDTDHKAPPFIIVCDVGHCFELYADFTGTGRAYTQFPDRNGYRVFLEDLRDPKARDLLKAIWTDPHRLDPTKNAVRVTREIARRLAAVSKSLEDKRNAKAEDVAHFLMRCLFTMFAEDTELLPKDSFRALLERSVQDPSHFAHRLKQLWADMEKGVEFSAVIDARVRHFNGGLFKNTYAFDLNKEEIGELLVAARADWKEVDPAIFGTLLEQALDPEERRKLGAHYTPRAYVQRLVDVTVMEPLRADWEAALTKAELAKEDGKDADAIAIVRAFHDQLTHTRVLDPACGTGNFLYVALELMKQLEGEVLETLTKLGDEQGLLTLKNLTVDPHLFLGLELNPRAAAIAELVVWIGYLQWHYRNTKGHPEEPILRAFENIQCMDAVLTWDGYPLPKVENGVETYPNARRPVWPEAEFIVGNPPFIGKGGRLREALGDDYVEALWRANPDVDAGSDFVLHWWDRAALILANPESALRRFGLVTTNSLSQTMNRRVLARYLQGKDSIALVFAVPDQPWTKASPDAAAVRIAMTVLDRVASDPQLWLLSAEHDLETDEPKLEFSRSVGKINPDLTQGADTTIVPRLLSNTGLSWNGMMLAGRGFEVDAAVAEHLTRLDGDRATKILKTFLHGGDLVRRSQKRWLIDFFGLNVDEARLSAPACYQHLLQTVKPERDKSRDGHFRDKWWLFGRPRPELRESITSLARYIATTETAKHRVFQLVPSSTLPDHMIICISSEDAYILAVLSSSAHVTWALRLGAWLGAGNDPRYSKSRTFDPFPFPDPPTLPREKLRHFGEELDATRKRVQAEHPDITLTGLYNVLEKVKAGAELTPQEDDVKTRGLVLIIKDLHDQIDAATAEAYGWPVDLSDDQILERLVALNAERAKEEAQGFVRWLRPEYQEPRFGKQAAAQKSGDLDLEEKVVAIDKGQPTFPKDRYEQLLAIEAALVAHAQPLDAAGIAQLFKAKATEARVKRVGELLTTLARYGRIIALGDGRFAARRAA